MVLNSRYNVRAMVKSLPVHARPAPLLSLIASSSSSAGQTLIRPTCLSHVQHTLLSDVQKKPPKKHKTQSADC